MFYSHEVLTSRKYGVATVWLVATLGQKSALRKVTRKAILDVDVQKACDTILTPDAPMALRLQSSLLYGVTRVYSQQCGYVLADAQNAQNAMRMLFKIVRKAGLDAEAGKARPDQLLLEDDPACHPDLLFAPLNDDLLNLNGPLITDSQLSLISSQGTTPFPQDERVVISPGGIVLPSSDFGDIGGFVLPGGGGSSRAPRPSSLLGRDEDIPLDDLDLGFDADGNLNPPSAHAPRSGRGPFLASDAANARVRQEHALGQQADLGLGNDDFLDMNMPIDDGYGLQLGAAGLSSDGYRPQPVISSDAPQSETAAAPQRRKARVGKALALDPDTKLRSGEIVSNSNNYLANMAAARGEQQARKAAKQAKENALYYILGVGLNGIGNGIGRSREKGPLAEMFSGPSLYKTVTGFNLEFRGQKRNSEGDESAEGRRVRSRLDGEDQVGRGGQMQLEDEGFLYQNDDVEMGRDAPDAREDISSMLPWNVSASKRGSSILRGPHSGKPGSVGAGGRLVSASPLHGRSRLSGLEPLIGTEGLTSDVLFGNDYGGSSPEGLTPEEEFELYGPGAQVDTQTAAQSQWQRAVLDRESNNFLGFIESTIEEKQAAQAGKDKIAESVEFEELLNPKENSRIVAAQALLHVLTLATKSLIKVRQAEAYGAIEMWIK